MARTKGMLNLSGNLEVNAQAPLDARTIVPTEADLTVANNFPYPYIGLEVYITGTGKKFRLINLDTTQSSSWHEISEGGGSGGGGHTIQDDGTDMTARDNLNFVGFNVTDDSTNNRTTVTFPNVDLSMLGVEAFQFSTDEKPVGMWTDRKILYAKTFTFSSSVTLQSNTWYETAFSGSGIERTINARAFFEGSAVSFPVYSGVYNNKIRLLQTRNAEMTGVGGFTIFYTKTTDSPLSSDEKFAGVTSGGEVIYERTISITTARNITTNSWNVIDEADSWFGSVDKIISGNVKRNDDCASMPCEFNKNNGHLRIDPWRNDYFNTQTRITVRYTKSS